MATEVNLRAYVLQRFRARFLGLLIGVAAISSGLYLLALHQSTRRQLPRSMEVARQVLVQAFDAGDPNLTVAYLKSTVSQDNFYSVEVRDAASGAALFGPLRSRSARWIESCARLDLGSRYGAELIACRRAVGFGELLACLLFSLTVAFVAALGIRFIRNELTDWSDGLSSTLDRLRALGPSNLDGLESSGALEGEPVRELAELRRRIIEILAESKRLVEYEATAKIAAQVAHDIQSPLAALESGEADVAAAAVTRIRAIADDLRRKQSVKPERSEVYSLLQSIVAEKRAQYRAMTGLRLEFDAVAADGAVIIEDALALGRAISNLLNNAVEALPPGGGCVKLLMKSHERFLEILIEDDGCGIPPDLLPRLAQEGVTFGKAGGSGLGLFHARTLVESWGGRLEISAGHPRGTVVRMTIPASKMEFVLIDDDALMRKTWSIAAKQAGVVLRCFGSVAEFLREAQGVPRSARIYVDSELGDGVRGEEASAEIHRLGFLDIYLATGHAPETISIPVFVRGVVGKTAPWGRAD